MNWRLLGASLLLTGCLTNSYPTDPTGRPAAPGTQEGWSEGRKLYEAACTRCHGSDARGVPGAGISLVGLKAGDEQVRAYVRTGKAGHMPAKGGYPVMTEAQLNVLVEYLRTLTAPRSQ